MISILHISDLHFTIDGAGSQFDRDLKIREALLADLGRDERKDLAAIVVTGDITYHGRAAEFARAKAWLEDVRKAAGVAPEGIFVVPGNHDVNQEVVTKASSLWDLHQGLRAQAPREDRLLSLQKKLQDPFDFLMAMIEYRAFATEYGCSTNTKEVAWVETLGDEHLLEDGTAVRIHGLNSALISDQEDKKANLLLGDFQFQHFNADPDVVSLVLCHHPHPWLLDGNEANDYFRNQTHVVLCGHDHSPRCYKEGGSLRLFAGAIHPNRRETDWEPCYHVLRLSVETVPARTLRVRVTTRTWRPKDKCFGPYAQPDGKLYHEELVSLPAWPGRKTPQAAITVSSPVGATVAAKPTKDEFQAARRKLIVHFFRLGTIARYQAAISAGVWDDADDALDLQARWTRVFERAEQLEKLAALWAAIAAQDKTLSGQPNPFTP